MRHLPLAVIVALLGSTFAPPTSHAFDACTAADIRMHEASCPGAPATCTITQTYDIDGFSCILDFGDQAVVFNGGNFNLLTSADLWAGSFVLTAGSMSTDGESDIGIFAVSGNIETHFPINVKGVDGGDGGAVHLRAYKGSISIGGNIQADGDGDPSGGGSGGPITVEAAKTITISSPLSSNGASSDGSGGEVTIVGEGVTISAGIGANASGNGDAGVIAITSTAAATIGGALNAKGAGSVVAGTGVHISAPGNISVTQAISADGDSTGNNGGSISIASAQNTVTINASVTANRGGSSNTGGAVSIEGCILTLQSGAKVRANGAGGKTTLTLRTSMSIASQARISATNGGTNEVFYRAAPAPSTPTANFDPPAIVAQDPDLLACPAANTCGNNQPNPNELCDKGTDNACDDCSSYCEPVTPCAVDDGNPCTIDSCDSQLGCLHIPGNDGISCDDGNVCTASSTCNHGVCSGPITLNCSDGNPCTNDTCNKVTGCGHTPKQPGAGCDDGNVCTYLSTCQGGVCQGGLPFPGGACDDHNPCTINTGCSNGLCQGGTFVSGPCTDNDACTSNDTCSAGVCQPGAPLVCNDGMSSTEDTCDHTNGCEYDYTPLTLVRTISPPSSTDYAFGTSLATLNGKLIVGMIFRMTTQGIQPGGAYRFDPTTGALLQSYANPAGSTSVGTWDRHVAAVGGSVMTADPHVVVSGVQEAGAAYLFNVPLQTFVASPPGGQFGTAIAGLGSDFLITHPGAAAAYRINPAGPSVVATYLDPQGIPSSIGNAITSVGSRVIVGTNARIHVYDAAAGTFQRTIFNPQGTSVTGVLGYAMTPVGSTVLVSAYADDLDSVTPGRAYLIDPAINQTTDMAPVVKMYSHTFPNDTGYNSKWGWSVANTTERVAVSAPYLWSGTGEVYLYDRDTQAEIQTLVSPYATPGDQGFGAALVNLDRSLAVGHFIDVLGNGVVHIYAPCGNGHVDPGETCDDGNTTNGDGCSSTCQTS